jgi:tetratricopeptide (TPR) repeat protein
MSRPASTNVLPRLLAVCLGALLALPLSCSPDPAEREYMAALRGEETGMGRAEQLIHVERAIAMAPRRGWYRETHAIYSIDTHAFPPAAADLDTAIQLADRPYLRFLRGLVSCQQGKYARSLPDFDRAIEGQPENAQFYRGRSLARSALGRYREALEDAERLRTMAPQQGETYYARGVALAGLGRLRESVQAYDEALRLRPELTYPLRARAAAYERLGDTLLAAADLEAAARKERDNGCALCMDPFRY